MRALERLQREPYRLFFPLGLLLSWAGAGYWLPFGLGLTDEYRSIFHAMTQVQGFLICFALGFLFTMLPRRTESPPASLALLVLAALCPLATSVAAWRESWAIAQMFWLILAMSVTIFVVRRLGSRQAKRRPPHGFIWLPAALAAGIVGAVLTGVGMIGEGGWTLHQIGRGLVLQGLFLGLVLGVGGFAIPLMTRGESAPDVGPNTRDRLLLLFHLALIALLYASFFVEHLWELRLGLGLRAAVCWLVLLGVARIHRPPKRPGAVRWAIWLAAWCVPTGYTVALLAPVQVNGPLHITFIGGFGLLALAVSSQVVLGHGGYEALKQAWLWPILALVVALAGATASRFMMVVQQERMLFWAASASGLFLFGTALWGGLLLPRLLRAPRREEMG